MALSAPVSYTHLDVYKRQDIYSKTGVYKLNCNDCHQFYVHWPDGTIFFPQIFRTFKSCLLYTSHYRERPRKRWNFGYPPDPSGQVTTQCLIPGGA